jgi:hypothetical protein
MIIRIKFYFGYDLAIFDRVMPLRFRKKMRFPFIFVAEIAHTEIKFSIQNYHMIIWIKFYFGYNLAIFDRVMTLGLRKIAITCSFQSFSSLKLVNK